MKNINVAFEDSEMEAIVKKKGKRSWRQFILDCSKEEEKKGL